MLNFIRLIKVSLICKHSRSRRLKYPLTVTVLQAEAMMYIFYGSLAILLWKCGTQLLKEVRYKTAKEEEEKLRKEKLTKSGSKYSKVFY